MPLHNGNKTPKLITLFLLIVGITLSTAGCLSHEVNVQNPQNITIANTTPLVQENVCYEINQTSNTTEKYPVGYPDQFEEYWVHIDPIADHKEGDVFQITGCTNVPNSTQFWGGIIQSEYFTPYGESFIPSTVKNVSFTSGYTNSVRYFSYEVNSTGFPYSIYQLSILPTDPFNRNTSVSTWRNFNITH